jgi:hypothetical protein
MNNSGNTSPQKQNQRPKDARREWDPTEVCAVRKKLFTTVHKKTAGVSRKQARIEALLHDAMRDELIDTEQCPLSEYLEMRYQKCIEKEDEERNGRPAKPVRRNLLQEFERAKDEPLLADVLLTASPQVR